MTPPTRRADAGWELALALDREASRQPLFLRIARAIVEEICRGRFKPGDKLPGTRTLARSLGVNRITVLTAYDELSAEGWITVRPASGARISAELPEPTGGRIRVAPRAAVPQVAAYDLPPGPIVEYAPEMRRDMLVFGGSSPDTRLLQVEPLARAYGSVLRQHRGRALGYAGARGNLRLRAALASVLSATRGLVSTPDQVFVTRGSQMALALVARALIRPGDLVAVEALGYRHAWESFRLAGAALAPVPVDRNGLDVASLERLARARQVRAIYVTPHHQFPTTVTLSAERRVRLLELARVHRIAVVEDDYDHEFHYAGRPVLPLASLDRAGVVIYIGTLSKVLAPGLRIGYVLGPPDLLERLEAHREFLDMQGDHALEEAVAELLEDGEVQRHVRRARRQYQRRRDVLADLLCRAPRGLLSFEVPAGGIAIWVGVRHDINVETWAARALKRGVAFQTARAFTFDGGPRPFARLGFGVMDEPELRRAFKVFLDARPAP